MKLDLGCGPNPAQGFEGVDQYAFDGKVKHVFDLRTTPWPFADNSVDEARCSHFIEHLTGQERCAFVNELYRVLKPEAGCLVITPHWASNRAYGDPTHQWPPVSEMWFYYLSREWRLQNAPHTDKSLWAPGYDCDLECTWNYNQNPAMKDRHPDYQQYAIMNYKDAAFDTVATLKARKKA